jgi:hypothetical protein
MKRYTGADKYSKNSHLEILGTRKVTRSMGLTEDPTKFKLPRQCDSIYLCTPDLLCGLVEQINNTLVKGMCYLNTVAQQ